MVFGHACEVPRCVYAWWSAVLPKSPLCSPWALSQTGLTDSWVSNLTQKTDLAFIFPCLKTTFPLDRGEGQPQVLYSGPLESSGVPYICCMVCCACLESPRWMTNGGKIEVQEHTRSCSCSLQRMERHTPACCPESSERACLVSKEACTILFFLLLYLLQHLSQV